MTSNNLKKNIKGYTRHDSTFQTNIRYGWSLGLKFQPFEPSTMYQVERYRKHF
jgi:hypothetical protein